MTPEKVLFGLTLLGYFLASLAYHSHLFAGSERAVRSTCWLVPATALVHAAGIGVWCMHYGAMLQDPGMPYSALAWFLGLIQIGANRRPRWASLGSLTMPLAFIAQFFATLRAEGANVETLAATALLKPHVVVLLLGFAAFTVAFCLAVIYLVQSRLLKTKQIGGLFSRLPPLESVSSSAHALATVGFTMLTLGIITGTIAAPQKWGPTWYLDPHTLTGVVAWAIYAVYLGVSTGLGWRGKKTVYFLIAGFLVVLFAFVASSSRPKATPQVQQVPAMGGASVRA